MLEEFHSPEEVFRCSEEELQGRINHMKWKQTCSNKNKITEYIMNSRNRDKVKSRYEQLKKKRIRFICINDEDYPRRLRNIKNYPFGLYVKGDISEIEKPSVAIVGARNGTAYGKKAAKDIGFELAAAGINVISGLAYGIDSCGLWGAVDAGGYSTAVMGCGVDVCYPRENIELYERIMDRGCIISDYPVGTPPMSWQFPLRNRIISGLADKIIVVEAREKSGSLITAEYALEQGKDIFAVPGRMGDVLSSGCNQLIKDGAGIVISPKDVLREMEYFSADNCKNSEKNKYLLEKDLETLYSCVDLFPKNIQQLMDETGKDSAEIIQKLIKLQMMNLIDEPTKNYYSRKI